MECGWLCDLLAQVRRLDGAVRCAVPDPLRLELRNPAADPSAGRRRGSGVGRSRLGRTVRLLLPVSQWAVRAALDVDTALLGGPRADPSESACRLAVRRQQLAAA